jgi:hypothetical protein
VTAVGRPAELERLVTAAIDDVVSCGHVMAAIDRTYDTTFTAKDSRDRPSSSTGGTTGSLADGRLYRIHNIVILLIGIYSGPPYSRIGSRNGLKNLYRHRYREARKTRSAPPPIPLRSPRETVR